MLDLCECVIQSKKKKIVIKLSFVVKKKKDNFYNSTQENIKKILV